MTPVCQHCHKYNASRPRCLCWTCYYKPFVRALYHSTSKYARRGVGNFCGNAPLPETPTQAPPGSEAKLRAMIARAAKRQSLFHPEDAPLAPLAKLLAG